MEEGLRIQVFEGGELLKEWRGCDDVQKVDGGVRFLAEGRRVQVFGGVVVAEPDLDYDVPQKLVPVGAR